MNTHKHTPQCSFNARTGECMSTKPATHTLQIDGDALFALAAELLEILEIITDHACEMYPHFESERGQREIAQARAAIAKATGKE
jgi:hypothetical protein